VKPGLLQTDPRLLCPFDAGLMASPPKAIAPTGQKKTATEVAV
jgi:hypothetical protein